MKYKNQEKPQEINEWDANRAAYERELKKARRDRATQLRNSWRDDHASGMPHDELLKKYGLEDHWDQLVRKVRPFYRTWLNSGRNPESVGEEMHDLLSHTMEVQDMIADKWDEEKKNSRTVSTSEKDTPNPFRKPKPTTECKQCNQTENQKFINLIEIIQSVADGHNILNENRVQKIKR